MKTILKAALAGACLAAAGAGAWKLRADAQPAPAPAGAPAQAADVPPAWLPRVLRHLDLTPDQRAQLAKIRQDHRAAAAAIRGEANLTPEQRRAKLHEASRAALVAAGKVLNAGQRAKLDRIRRMIVRSGLRSFAVRQELRHERRFWGMADEGPRFHSPGTWGPPGDGRDRMGPGAGRGGWMRGADGSGDLTPEQRERIAALTKAYRSELRAIVGDWGGR